MNNCTVIRYLRSLKKFEISNLYKTKARRKQFIKLKKIRTHSADDDF